MQTLPRSVSEGRPGITADLTRHPATGSNPLTPAQRVALTIALLNQGFDVVDQVARTCLTGCTRRIGRSQTAPTRGDRDPDLDAVDSCLSPG